MGTPQCSFVGGSIHVVVCVVWRVPTDLGMGHKLRATGGHGGDGGDVIIEASNHMNGLSFQTYVITAPSGEDATGVYRLAGLFVWPHWPCTLWCCATTGAGKHGRKGKDLHVFVPCGTVVKEVFRVRWLAMSASPHVECGWLTVCTHTTAGGCNTRPGRRLGEPLGRRGW